MFALRVLSDPHVAPFRGIRQDAKTESSYGLGAPAANSAFWKRIDEQLARH